MGCFALTESELSAAKDLARIIGVYKSKDAVAEKGDAARLHVGVTVQKVMAIMESHDLEPFAYSFIGYDKWDDVWESLTETVQVDTIQRFMGLDKEENEISVEGSVYEERPLMEDDGVTQKRNLVLAGANRYSLRPDGLNAFIMRGLAEAIFELLG